MTFIYEIAEVQYMALVMIVPAIYLIAGFICNAGNKKEVVGKRRRIR